MPSKSKALEMMTEEERQVEERRKELIKRYQGPQLNAQIHQQSKGISHSKGFAGAATG
jgi:hypothetical protein